MMMIWVEKNWEIRFYHGSIVLKLKLLILAVSFFLFYLYKMTNY